MVAVGYEVGCNHQQVAERQDGEVPNLQKDQDIIVQESWYYFTQQKETQMEKMKCQKSTFIFLFFHF